MTCNFDRQFNSLHKNSGLTWLPWVGKNYEKNRVLVLGESNYANNDAGKTALEAKRAVDGNINFTREVVYDLGLRQIKLGVKKLHRSNMTFGRLVRLLSPHGDGVGATTGEHRQVWHDIAYMDVVQNAVSWVNDNKKKQRERPSTEAFFNGWRVVMKVLEVLKPRMIIVLGVALSKTFFKSTKKDFREISINDVRLPEPFTYKNESLKVKVIPIAHPASFRKSWSMQKWKQYLQSCMVTTN